MGLIFHLLIKFSKTKSDIPNCTNRWYSCCYFLVSGTASCRTNIFYSLTVNDQIHLNWETATEINNYGFEIERSISNSTAWQKVGFVEGNGNSNSEKEYNFVDKNVSFGNKYFYRLKEINTNGSFEYSEVVEADLSIPLDFSLSQNYPNPFNPTTKIKYTIPAVGTGNTLSVQLKVYDILGNEIAILVNEEKPAGTYEVEFGAKNLPSGMYFYKLTVGNNSEIKKMMLLK